MLATIMRQAATRATTVIGSLILASLSQDAVEELQFTLDGNKL